MILPAGAMQQAHSGLLVLGGRAVCWLYATAGWAASNLASRLRFRTHPINQVSSRTRYNRRRLKRRRP